jgi:hypothetical protein
MNEVSMTNKSEPPPRIIGVEKLISAEEISNWLSIPLPEFLAFVFVNKNAPQRTLINNSRYEKLPAIPKPKFLFGNGNPRWLKSDIEPWFQKIEESTKYEELKMQ